MKTLPHFISISACLLLTSQLSAAYDGRYLQWSTEYANEMRSEGTDRYGSVTSPLFVSMLNRDPVDIFSNPKSTLPNLSGVGIRQHDRSWNAGNPLHDHQLYDLLYSLTDYTGDTSYRDSANAAISWFFLNTQSPVTGLMAWGEHLAWDVGNESVTTQTNASKVHEMYVWDFWTETFALAPSATEDFALGLWNHQMVSQVTGDFNRHCRYDISSVETSGNSFPRYGGNMIAAWGNVYSLTSDTILQATLLGAIDKVTSFLQSRRKPVTNAMPAGTGSSTSNTFWPSSTLLMCREIAPIVDLLPEPSRTNLLEMLNESDAVFLSLTQDLGPGGKGFISNAYASTLNPYTSPEHDGYTSYWSPGYGYQTAADMALLIIERAERPHLTAQQVSDYRSLALQAADRYLSEGAPTGVTMVPEAYAKPIQLLVHAYQLTGNLPYLTRAQTFADEAKTLFITGNSPLPRVSSAHDHYETISGGDDLMLACFNLHLAMLDEEAPGGVLSFKQSSTSVNEQDLTVTVTVSRNGPVAGTVSVDWATTSGTALPGDDFVANTGTLIWTDGDNADKEVVVTLVNDSVPEMNVESFSIVLTNPTGQSLVLSPEGIDVQITDDDTTPPPPPEFTRFNVNFGQSSYTNDGSNTWTTFNMASASGAPLSYSDAILADTEGSTAKGLSFNLSSSGISATGAALHTSTTATDFTGNPFGWFNPDSPAQREVFTFDGSDTSNSWTFVFDGFDPTDDVTFEWVARRASKNGIRRITLSGGPSGGTDTILIDDEESDETAQFASIELTGSTSYTFILSNTSPNGLWASTANAVSIEIKRELTASESWRKAWFNQIENSGDAAESNDYDLDGLVNLMERAFGSNPLIPDLSATAFIPPQGALIDGSGEDEHLYISYRRLTGGSGTTGVDYTVDGITYTVIHSNDLQGTWNSGAVTPIGDPLDNGDGTETISVRLDVPLSSTEPQFIRLSVSVP